MANVALVVFADTRTHPDVGRVANALTTAREFEDAGEEVSLIFDGAGTRWVGELFDPEHRLGGAFDCVKDEIGGACAYCAAPFGVKEEVRVSEVPLMDEYKGHPSLVSQGYEVITFQASRFEAGGDIDER